jgi:hypothetical protein
VRLRVLRVFVASSYLPIPNAFFKHHDGSCPPSATAAHSDNAAIDLNVLMRFSLGRGAERTLPREAKTGAAL